MRFLERDEKFDLKTNWQKNIEGDGVHENKFDDLKRNNQYVGKMIRIARKTHIQMEMKKNIRESTKLNMRTNLMSNIKQNLDRDPDKEG